MSDSDDPTGNAPASNPFDEALAYLLVFSDALLDLVPDAVVVLDAGLRVRNANAAFAERFGYPDREAARGASLTDHPLLSRTLPGVSGRSLRDALGDLFQGDAGRLDVERLEAAEGSGEPPWAVRAAAWDTEHDSFRRILAWFRPLPEPPPEPERPFEPEPEPAPPPAPEPPPAAPPAPEPRPDAPGAPAKRDEALARQLLERLGAAACLTEPDGRVLAANTGFRTLFGDPPADGLPRALVQAGAPELLRQAADAAEPVQRRLSIDPAGEGALPFEIEVQPMLRNDDERGIGELLLLLREVPPMNPSTPTSASPYVPEAVDAILAGDQLARWPAPATGRVLVVEADSWTRMAVTDTLRDAGLHDFAACDSGPAVWARHDPSSFALVLVGVDASARDAAEFCRRMTNDHPAIPVVAFTEGPPERARAWVAGLPLAGLVAGSVRAPELSRVAVGLVRRAGGAAPAPPPPAPAPDVLGVDSPSDRRLPDASPASPAPFEGAESVEAGAAAAAAIFTPFELPAAPAIDVAATPPPAAPAPAAEAPAAAAPDAGVGPEIVVIGAQVLDLPGLRRLARSSGIRVRMVYDPNPSAAGLVLARELKLPSTSDSSKLLEGDAPDAVLVGEGGGGDVLMAPKLASVPQILRDEIDLFTADPASFLEAARADMVTAPPVHEALPAYDAGSGSTAASAPEPVVPEPPAAPAAPAPPTEDVKAEAATELPAAAVATPEDAPPAAAAPAPLPPAEPVVPKALVMPARIERARPEAPAAPRWAEPAEAPPAPSVLDRDVSALAGAFDLLFDFERLCASILESAMESVHGASGSLMLIDESGQYLRIVTAYGLSDLVVQDTRQRVGQGISGRVAEEGEPLLLVGTIGDERFPVRGERPEIPSAVCVPVIAEGRVLGVMNVNSDPHSDPFDQPELRRLADLGRRVGPALDRAWQLRVVRGRSFEMSVRAAIESIAASGGDLLTRLRQVAGRVVELLRVDTCAIWVHDPRNSVLALRALAGTQVSGWESVTVPVGSGLPGWVARNRQPLVLRNVPEDPTDADAARVTHVLAPLRHHTDLVGVLAIESASGTLVDDKKLDLLRTIAAVLGEQISASQAQASSERMVTMLSALAELGVAFSAARERSSLGRLVAFTAATVLESDVAIVRLAREQAAPGAHGEDLLERMAAHGASPGEGDPLTELEDRVVHEVVARLAPVTQADLPQRAAESLLARSNVASLLAVPMTMDDELLGVITVFRVADARGQDVTFGDQDHEIASRLGDYAAGAAHRFSPSSRRDEEDEA